MAAISQKIPTLLGGVSQQPDPIKLPGQVADAVNVYLDPTFGCVKRPPTSFIKALNSEIPRDAYWFPIFRDDNERYLACIYNHTTAPIDRRLRVFSADDGLERTVDISAEAQTYLNAGVGDTKDKFSRLTINDFTFLANPAVRVSMSKEKSEQLDQEALVVVNQVGYNTTYAIDLLRDGDELQQVKTTSASSLVVQPGSWEDDDGDGSCGAFGTKEVTEADGLRYRLTVNCTPVQVTNYEDGPTYPTQVSLKDTGDREFADWCAIELGEPGSLALNSYAYTTVNTTIAKKNISIRVEARVVKICQYKAKSGEPLYRTRWSLSSLDVLSYEDAGDDKPKWRTGGQGVARVTASSDTKAGYSANGINVCDATEKVIPAGATRRLVFQIENIDTAPKTPSYDLKSSYTASVQLLSGGSGPQRGDTYTTTLNGKQYTIKVKSHVVSYTYESEFSVSYTTPTDATIGPLNVGTIVGALVSDINALNPFEAKAVGNVIHIKRSNNNRVFAISARGGSTDNAMLAIKGSISDVSKLPTVGYDGFTLKVYNTADTEADDYYLRFVTDNGIPGAGSWEETVAPGIRTQINESTMPMALVRQSDGSFKLRALDGTDDVNELSWADRTVGDDKTNPIPSFVKRKIDGMAFHMNRLALLSGDTVIMSQPGDYFNFFTGSAIAISDADPIDMAATSRSPAKLTEAISTPRGLVLFSRDAQFLMSSKDVAFAPATVQIEEISNYSYTSTVEPQMLGDSLFFNTDSTRFSKIYEMSLPSVNETPQVAENTRIIPEYIVGNLKWAASSPNNNLVAYGAQDNDVYLFKFWNQGRERSLAGWVKWTFGSEVSGMAFADDVGYVLTYNVDLGAPVLSKMNLLDDPGNATIANDGRLFEPRLDNYVTGQDLLSGVSADNSEYTRIVLPIGMVDEQETLTIQMNRAEGTYYTVGEVKGDPLGRTVDVLTSALKGVQSFNIGIAYPMEVVLPHFYVKSDKEVDRRNVPVVENVYLDMYLSGAYTVILERTGYPDNVQYLEPKVYDVYQAGNSSIITAESKPFSVFCNGDLARIRLTSASPLPAGIAGYSWEGHYNTRGITRT